jgi:hypothetical protein
MTKQEAMQIYNEMLEGKALGAALALSAPVYLDWDSPYRPDEFADAEAEKKYESALAKERKKQESQCHWAADFLRTLADALEQSWPCKEAS